MIVTTDPAARPPVSAWWLTCRPPYTRTLRIDLLLNVAWGLPLVSREERLYRFQHEHRVFLESFQPRARQMLDMGSVVELANRFGGAQPLHQAIDELGRRLLDAS